MAENQTIKQEIETLGINPQDFDNFYQSLRENKQLPSGEIVQWDQYKKITDYLRQSNVLGEDNKINEKDFKIFDSKKYLEARLENIHKFPTKSTPSGGIVPCRNKNYTSGGITPCRQEEDSLDGLIIDDN